MLLPDDKSGEWDELAKDFYKHVRWDFSSEQARLAKWTANKILENISERMEQHFALSHVEYINRERAFAQRGECIFHAHRLPKWAKNDPKKFFQAADKIDFSRVLEEYVGVISCKEDDAPKIERLKEFRALHE